MLYEYNTERIKTLYIFIAEYDNTNDKKTGTESDAGIQTLTDGITLGSNHLNDAEFLDGVPVIFPIIIKSIFYFIAVQSRPIVAKIYDILPNIYFNCFGISITTISNVDLDPMVANNQLVQ
jgi:hypothetical protein